jgi:multidrug efflux pump subunit AcrB
MVLVKRQFASPDEFGAIVLRANADGSAVRLRDVARIEGRRADQSVHHPSERATPSAGHTSAPHRLLREKA